MTATTPRSSRLLLAVLTLFVVAEACVIIYLLNAHSASRSSSFTHTASSSAATPYAVITPEVRIAQLEAENAKLKKAIMGVPFDTARLPDKIAELLATPPDDPTETKWQRLASLNNNPLSDTRVAVTEQSIDTSDNSKLSPVFVSLFEITPQEKATLEKTLADATAQVNDLTMKNATTRLLGDGSFEITVNTFPADGGPLYDQLHDQFRKTLGDERYTAMQALGGRELDMTFNNFGAESRTLTVSRDTKTGCVDVMDASNTEGSRRVSMNKVPDASYARQLLGKLGGLIPPDF